MELAKYHKEVTNKYLSVSKKLPAKEEKYLQETMFQTSYRFRKTDKEAYKKLFLYGFLFLVILKPP